MRAPVRGPEAEPDAILSSLTMQGSYHALMQEAVAHEVEVL